MLTDKCIKEYSYPVYNCDQNEDNCFVDYVELEIIPDGIGFLQQKLLLLIFTIYFTLFCKFTFVLHFTIDLMTFLWYNIYRN